MKYIDRLLQGAPVEWCLLGEVGEFTRGSGLQKKDFTTEGVGCIHYGQIYTHYGIFAFETKTFVSEGFAQKARKAQCGDLVIATTSENDEDLCKAVAWLGKEEVVVSSDACFYTHKMAPKYVSYFFQSTHFQKQKRTFITGTKVRRVNTKDLAKIEIPIPSVAVQEEVVRILDKFTALEAELEAELKAELDCRKRQYQYYRDALLTFDLSPSDGLCHSPLFPAPFAVEWLPLGEVGEIYGGLTGKNKDDFNSGDALYIPYKNIFDNISVSPNHLEPVVVAPTEKQNEVKYGDLLFTASSETPEEVGMSSAVTSYFETPVYLNSFCFGVRFNEDVTLIPEFSKFLFRSTQMRRQISRTASGVTRFNVSKSRFKKLEIPIPPLEVQERIVEILDKFDTLVNSISEGLPREIELRRKQYEYYRDALLSFEPLISNF